jgi:L-lysine 2,3-aminomutase
VYQPIKIPLEFASLIDKDNPNDPLLKMLPIIIHKKSPVIVGAFLNFFAISD